MSSSLAELAALVDGRIEGGSGREEIHGVASTLDAVEGEIAFYGNKRYLSELESCGATAILVPLDFDREIAAVRVHVENPSRAFSKIVERFIPAQRPPVPGIAPTAIIAEGVVLGEGISVGHYAVVEAGVTIGDRCVVGAGTSISYDVTIGRDCHIYPNVTIRERTRIGDRVVVHPGAVIGGDGYGFQKIDGRHVKVPQLGIVQIDDDVEIGCGTTIDRARFGRTWIKEGSKLDNQVQIGHNAVIGRHCLIVAHTGIAGSTKLEDYVTIGGHVGIAGHLKLGEGCTIAGYSGVIGDVEPGAVVGGYPARNLREFMTGQARVRKLDRILDRVKKLEEMLADRLAD